MPQTSGISAESDCLTVLEAESSTLRCQQAWFLPRATGENMAYPLASDSLAYRVPSSPSLNEALPLYVSLSPNFPLFMKILVMLD